MTKIIVLLLVCILAVLIHIGINVYKIKLLTKKLGREVSFIVEACKEEDDEEVYK